MSAGTIRPDDGRASLEWGPWRHLAIAAAGGLLLALMEIAAILSQPGVPRASAPDLATLTTWLATVYFVTLAGAGLAAAILRIGARRFTPGGILRTPQGAFTAGAAAFAIFIWIRTIGRLGAETPIYPVLALLVGVAALAAGLGAGVSLERATQRGQGRGIVLVLLGATVFLAVLIGVSQAKPGPFGRPMPPAGVPVRLAIALGAGLGSMLVGRLVRGRPARAAGWAAAGLTLAWIAVAASDFSRLVSRAPAPASNGRPAGVAAAQTGAEAPAAPGSASRPNVILISIDTLRADHLSCYGYGKETSPAIDRLAAEGIRFEKTASTASFTLPAHASMMTGLFPSSHGATYQNRDPERFTVRGMAQGYPTLASLLRERGYETAGFVSGPLLSRQFGFARGFDHYDDRYDRLQSTRGRLFSRTVLYRWMSRAGLFSGRDLDAQRTADEMNPLLLSWLDSRTEAGRPFFLFAHYWDPHGPYAPPPPLDRREDGSPIRVDYDMDRLLTGQYTLTPSALADTLELYDREIQYVDRHIGELLDRLRRDGLLDRSIVFLTSDHGESFGEHGHWEHSRVLYEDLLAVPFVMRLPGGRDAGTVVSDTIAQPTDILPTVLGLMGEPAPEGTEGRDLLAPPGDDALKGRGLAFAELDRNVDWPARWGGRFDRDLAVARTLTWKLIVSSRGSEELFDLSTDPAELADRRAHDPEAAATLRALLDAWQRSLSSPAEGDSGGIDEGLKDSLRSLGYVQ